MGELDIEIVGMVFVSVFLLLQAWWDLQTMELPLSFNLAVMALGIGYCIVESRPLEEIFPALVPGIICLILGRITRQAVGYGDGMVLLGLAMFLEWKEILELCTVAFCISALWALAGLITGRLRIKDKLPFIPFLFLAWGIQLLRLLGEGV